MAADRRLLALVDHLRDRGAVDLEAELGPTGTLRVRVRFAEAPILAAANPDPKVVSMRQSMVAQAARKTHDEILFAAAGGPPTPFPSPRQAK